MIEIVKPVPAVEPTPAVEPPAPREMQEKVTLWTWRGLLLAAIVLVFIAAIMAAWAAPNAHRVLWSGLAALGLALAVMWVRDGVFKHR